MADGEPIRILCVFGEPVDGAEAEAERLARDLDPARYRIDAIACVPTPEAAARPGEGLAVDLTPHALSFDDTVAYLAGRIPAYDLVIAWGNVADVRPALERLHRRPPSIEYGTHPGAILPSGLRQWRAAIEEAVAEARPAPVRPSLFRSFFQGGFESSTHIRGCDRRRVDVIAATLHDRHAADDYRALAAHGILTVRDGLRWHRIETAPGRYDWQSARAQLDAARATGCQVIWDLLHYGWPDGLEIWRPEFVGRFAAFARAAAGVISGEVAGPRFYAPVNEISFFSWAGGDVGYFNPFAHARGFELKAQLARAAIAAMEAILEVDPSARFVHADPAIHVICDPARPEEAAQAEGHRQAQFQGWDMLAGRIWPQLGGRAGLLDIVGVNYYHDNQWIHGSGPIGIGHPLYRPFRAILAETHARYGRPIFVAETGIEGERRPAWLAYVCAEVRAAMAAGVPVEGICLYPVLDHPGWDDGRYCPNGLLGFSPGTGLRVADPPLAAELARQRRDLAAWLAGINIHSRSPYVRFPSSESKDVLLRNDI